jgi:hypothetical protein
MTFGPVGSVVQALRSTITGSAHPHDLAMSPPFLRRRRGEYLPPPRRALRHIGIVALWILTIIPVRLRRWWLHIDLGRGRHVYRSGGDDRWGIHIRHAKRYHDPRHNHHGRAPIPIIPVAPIAIAATPVPRVGWHHTARDQHGQQE